MIVLFLSSPFWGWYSRFVAPSINHASDPISASDQDILSVIKEEIHDTDDLVFSSTIHDMYKDVIAHHDEYVHLYGDTYINKDYRPYLLLYGTLDNPQFQFSGQDINKALAIDNYTGHISIASLSGSILTHGKLAFELPSYLRTWAFKGGNVFQHASGIDDFFFYPVYNIFVGYALDSHPHVFSFRIETLEKVDFEESPLLWEFCYEDVARDNDVGAGARHTTFSKFYQKTDSYDLCIMKMLFDPYEYKWVMLNIDPDNAGWRWFQWQRKVSMYSFKDYAEKKVYTLTIYALPEYEVDRIASTMRWEWKPIFKP